MAYVLTIKRIIARCPLLTLLIFGFYAGSVSGQAWAQEAPPNNQTIETTAIDNSADQAAGQADDFLGWQSLSGDEMSYYSGGTGTTFGDVGINLATNSSSLTGNSVDGTVETGMIQDLNLNDVGGINTMMFNTGNNVNFQSNTLINIFVK